MSTAAAARTFDATVVESDDLRQTTSVDIFVCAARVDEWRRGTDFVYRLLTSQDTRELNECVLGLVSSGNNGTKVGLLRSKYGISMQPLRVLDDVERDIIDSDLKRCDAAHRMTCHFFIFVALVMEPDFIQYALLGTHNREAIRYYVNDVMRPALSNLLTGAIINGSTEDKSSFDVSTFVRQGRLSYALYCLPRHVACVV
jgi:hypothetical protein